MGRGPVQVVLHTNKKAVGIRVDDLTITHNMVLRGAKLGRNFQPIDEAEVPPELVNYLAAAKRNAEEVLSR